MKILEKIFRRTVPLAFRRGDRGEAMPLRVEGATTRLTPEADEAETAAAALLASMADRRKKRDGANGPTEPIKPNEPINTTNPAAPADSRKAVTFYRQLAKRLGLAHAVEARAAKRYVAYCEEQLRGTAESRNYGTTETANLEVRGPANPLAALEDGLFRHQNAVEREGGELLRRWQRCLAEAIVRQTAPPLPDDGSQRVNGSSHALEAEGDGDSSEDDSSSSSEQDDSSSGGGQGGNNLE